MKLSTQLAQTRRRKNLTAASLSSRTGFDTSNIYAIEHGRRDARESTIEAIADALGAQLLLVDTDHRGTVADAAEEIREALSAGHGHAAAQVLIQVYSNLTSLDALAALTLAHHTPRPVSDRWDAALAGVVETALQAKGLPAPAWTSTLDHDPRAQWDPWTEGRLAVDAQTVPGPLRRRGVYISQSELESA